MKGIIAIIFGLVALSMGCQGANYQGQMDTPIEYFDFTNQGVTEYEYEQLISFLKEAEIMMRKPIHDAYVNEKGIKVFPEQFTTKNDLFEYYQTYLSNELADTLTRKITDISKSDNHSFLAVSEDDIDWYSIFDADPKSIKVVLHTTVQSVVEMDLREDVNTRLQYTVMKTRLGENPKIVQKTVLYN